MNEPTLRIYVTPNGVLKIDALLQEGQEREQNYNFCERVLGAIRNLDKEVRQVVNA